MSESSVTHCHKVNSKMSYKWVWQRKKNLVGKKSGCGKETSTVNYLYLHQINKPNYQQTNNKHTTVFKVHHTIQSNLWP